MDKSGVRKYKMAQSTGKLWGGRFTGDTGKDFVS